MRKAPRHLGALALAVLAACSGVEPTATTDVQVPQAALTGGYLPVTAAWGNAGTGSITFMHRTTTGLPQLGTQSRFYFDAPGTVALLAAYDAAPTRYFEITGNELGVVLETGGQQFTSFAQHDEVHDLWLPTDQGGFEHVAWVSDLTGTGFSYTSRLANGRDRFAAGGSAGISFHYMATLGFAGIGGLLQRAVDDGVGVRLDFNPVNGGVFVGVAMTGGSGLSGTVHATGTYDVSLSGSVTRRP